MLWLSGICIIIIFIGLVANSHFRDISLECLIPDPCCRRPLLLIGLRKPFLTIQCCLWQCVVLMLRGMIWSKDLFWRHGSVGPRSRTPGQQPSAFQTVSASSIRHIVSFRKLGWWVSDIGTRFMVEFYVLMDWGICLQRPQGWYRVYGVSGEMTWVIDKRSMRYDIL